jgi:hypothetical protein
MGVNRQMSRSMNLHNRFEPGIAGRTQMHTPSTNCAFNAEDREVYRAWLQGTLAVYGAVAMCGIASVTFLAMANAPNVAEFLKTAVALASP